MYGVRLGVRINFTFFIESKKFVEWNYDLFAVKYEWMALKWSILLLKQFSNILDSDQVSLKDRLHQGCIVLTEITIVFFLLRVWEGICIGMWALYFSPRCYKWLNGEEKGWDNTNKPKVIKFREDCGQNFNVANPSAAQIAFLVKVSL